MTKLASPLSFDSFLDRMTEEGRLKRKVTPYQDVTILYLFIWTQEFKHE